MDNNNFNNNQNSPRMHLQKQKTGLFGKPVKKSPSAPGRQMPESVHTPKASVPRPTVRRISDVTDTAVSAQNRMVPASPQRPATPQRPLPSSNVRDTAKPASPARPSVTPVHTDTRLPADTIKQKLSEAQKPVSHARTGGTPKPSNPPMQNPKSRPMPKAADTVLANDTQMPFDNTSPIVIGTSKTKKSNVGKIILRVLAMFMTFVLMVVLTLVISLKMICSDISPAAKSTFVTTLLETGQLKFLASVFVPEEEIQKIVDSNTMEEMKDEVDSSLISININNAGGNNPSGGDGTVKDRPDIEVVEISGSTFYGTLLIIKDPSRVSLASIYEQNGNSWPTQGVTLDKLVTDSGAVAGMNSGLYDSSNNSGGRPFGIVVRDGKIELNEPQSWEGLVLIGFDENHILQIIDVSDMSAAETKAMIEEKGIRDAITFQEEATDKNNHFVKLVINGKAREMNGAGSGLNPRTCIGQCADGAVLMLVTDGRGKDAHLGASASDLIGIMMEYGAVNAANLDGGSSSCMYYNNEYLMTSVTFYYSNDSWRMPTAFIVK